MLVVEGAGYIQRFDSDGTTISFDNAFRRDVIVEDNAFLFSLGDFNWIRQHFAAIFDDKAMHFLCCTKPSCRTGHIKCNLKVAARLWRMPQTCGGTRHVHCHVATANDHNAFAEIEVVSAQIDVDQEVNRSQYTVKLFTLDVEVPATIGADTN